MWLLAGGTYLGVMKFQWCHIQFGFPFLSFWKTTDNHMMPRYRNLPGPMAGEVRLHKWLPPVFAPKNAQPNWRDHDSLFGLFVLNQLQPLTKAVGWKHHCWLCKASSACALTPSNICHLPVWCFHLDGIPCFLSRQLPTKILARN